MKISELYGKEVESIDKKRRGCVLGANVCGDRIEFLLCCDEDEKEFYIDVNCIISAGEKIIYEDAGARIKRTAPLRLGKAGYSEEGKFMGYLADCDLSGFRIKCAYVGKKKYDFARLACGDAVIIKAAAAKGAGKENGGDDRSGESGDTRSDGESSMGDNMTVDGEAILVDSDIHVSGGDTRSDGDTSAPVGENANVTEINDPSVKAQTVCDEKDGKAAKSVSPHELFISALCN